MLMIMETDNSYKYFQTALWEWIDNKRESGEAPQKLLSIKMMITEGTVSKYVNPNREKPIPYEMQVLFANACGHSYLSFIQKGKAIVESKESLFNPPAQVISLQAEADKRHSEVIAKFSNKEMALEINEMLVDIENMAGEVGLADAKKQVYRVLRDMQEDCEKKGIALQKTGTSVEPR